LIEIRFSTKLHPSAVFGVIYNSIQKNYPNVEKLPILQIPEPIREKDKQLKYKPYYKASNEQFIVQIGPDVFTVSSFPNYIGWSDFSKEIFSIIETIKNLKIIDETHRLGIRYINFFPYDIFESIDLEIFLKSHKLSSEKTLLRTELSAGEYKSTLQVVNDFTHNSKQGSVIDIDTFKDSDLDSFIESYEDLINKGHLSEKELFFSLLTESFLNSLEPEY